MSAMTDQGDDKDALLEKLDGLIQSGRARRRRDPPPVLTDAIPSASESEIPTLTDAVEVPGTSRSDEPSEQLEQTPGDVPANLDTPLDFEPANRASSEPAEPASSDSGASREPEADSGDRPDGHGIEPATLADMQDSISSRLVDVIEREMSALIAENSAHQSKLSVLQRSLRFALPELVRLRLQEDPGSDAGGERDDSANAES